MDEEHFTIYISSNHILSLEYALLFVIKVLLQNDPI